MKTNKNQSKLQIDKSKLRSKPTPRQGKGVKRMATKKASLGMYEKKPSDKLHTESKTSGKLQVEKKRQGTFVEERAKPKVDKKFQEALKKPSTVPQHVTSATVQHQFSNQNKDDNVGSEALQRTEQLAEKATYRLKSFEKLSENKSTVSLRTWKKSALVEERTEHFRFTKNSSTTASPTQQSSKNQWQKANIKKAYAKDYRASKTTANAMKRKVSTMGQKAMVSVKSNPTVMLYIIGGLALVLLICSTFSSCSSLGGAVVSSTVATTYTSEDDDLLEVEANYVARETALQSQIDNIETTHSGYDEYRYNLVEIGHDPHQLASILTAKYQSYTLAKVLSDLDTIFSMQYTLTLTPSTETRTDSEGNSYTVSILTVTLTNTPISSFVEELLDDNQYQLYQILLATKGNKPDIFGNYLGGAIGDIDFEIPDHYLDDEDFAKVYAEAIKYLGYPYQWGGQSPTTSFDCSGFMYWIYNASGVYTHSRLTAGGYYNICTKFGADQRQAGDFIFFTGTSSHATISHIGMYVGDGMMIHSASAGVSFAPVDTGYWARSDVFVCYGRLPI